MSSAYQQLFFPLAMALAVSMALVYPAHLRAGEFEDFSSAKSAFNAGYYDEAATRFTQMLEHDVLNPALLLEVHKLAGISFLFVGSNEKAEQHFFELLTRSPDFTIDPMLFPIEVIDFFNAVKHKSDERISELAAARQQETERRRIEEEKHRQAELEKLKRNIYIEKDRLRHSKVVAFMPLGAGQFQNGQKLKGFLFMGGELLLVAATITTFALHQSLYKAAEEPFSSSSEKQKFERYELGYRIANWSSLAALVALTTIGVVDALRHYQPEIVTWNKVEEKDVPEKLRGPKSDRKANLSMAPVVVSNGAGLMFGGTF